jgi:GNAT superfamily N-acetyltransferase
MLMQVSKLLALAFAASGVDDDGSAPLNGGSLVRYQLKLLAAMQWEASTLGKDFITVLATEAATGELAGVANLSPGLALADAPGHPAQSPGVAAACISNMAVAEAHRRRGLGRRLLAACERASRDAYEPPASLLGLAVYRSNEPAIALYEGSGFRVDDSWVDPRWAESAERGRVTFGRRQLMLKQLDGAGSQ